jgi:hypothetical protein
LSIPCEIKKQKWLTSWSSALLEKLPVVQLFKNFPTFYGTRRFITVFTRALHLSPSWARSIQSISPHPTYLIVILIRVLSTHLRLDLPSVHSCARVYVVRFARNTEMTKNVFRNKKLTKKKLLRSKTLENLFSRNFSEHESVVTNGMFSIASSNSYQSPKSPEYTKKSMVNVS